jgi:hypothetical protein
MLYYLSFDLRVLIQSCITKSTVVYRVRIALLTSILNHFSLLILLKCRLSTSSLAYCLRNHAKKQEWTQVIWRKVSSSCSTCDIRRVTLTLMEFDHWCCYIVLHKYQSWRFCICPSFTYGFWLTFWCLQTFITNFRFLCRVL